jgi:hypothetical protein
MVVNDGIVVASIPRMSSDWYPALTAVNWVVLGQLAKVGLVWPDTGSPGALRQGALSIWLLAVSNAGRQLYM